MSENQPSPRLQTYFARVDAALRERDDVRDRCDFLADLIEQWIARYEDFKARVDRGAPTPAGTTAFDYLDTLSALDARLSAIECARVPAVAS